MILAFFAVFQNVGFIFCCIFVFHVCNLGTYFYKLTKALAEVEEKPWTRMRVVSSGLGCGSRWGQGWVS